MRAGRSGDPARDRSRFSGFRPVSGGQFLVCRGAPDADLRYLSRKKAMSVPLPVVPQSLPVAGTGPFLARLPAFARAALRWTEPGLTEASRRLRTEPLNDDVIASVAASVWVPYRHILAEVAKTFVSDAEAYRKIIIESTAQMTRKISATLAGDLDAIDTLQWIAEWLRAYLTMGVHMLPSIAEALQTSIDDPDAVEMLCRSPEGGAFRAQVLMGAADDEATASGDPQRLRDLVDLAFLELCRGTDATRETMPWLPAFPFAGESPSERGARALRYTEAFRASGSPEEHAAFQAAMAERTT